MTKVKALHKKWMKKKEYRKAYQELAPEFTVARAVIKARATAGLTQEQLAQHGNHPIGNRQAGERARPPIHANTGASGHRHRNTPQNQLRTRSRAPLAGNPRRETLPCSVYSTCVTADRR